MSNLPILYAGGELAVIDPTTQELTTLQGASDHALAHACEKVAELDKQLREARQALAHELRDRHGVGTSHAGGYQFQLAVSTSWPVGATKDALDRLLEEGRIGHGDYDRCLPAKPKPDGRQIEALLKRLLASDGEAYTLLAEVKTVSPPSVRGVQHEAVGGRVE